MISTSNEKKWKYLSFALMGILATGIFSTQAFGTSPTLTDIMNKLIGVDTKVTAIKTTTDTNLDAKVSTRATQTSVNNVQSDVTAIKSTTDTNLDAKVSTRATPADIDNAKNAIIDNSGVKHVFGFHDSMDPGPGGTDVVEIIPASDGKVFTGHLTGRANVFGAFGDLAYAQLQCDVGDPTSSDLGPSVLVDIDTVGSHNFNVDFSCTHLSLTEGISAPRDYDPAEMAFWITGEYTETTVG